MVGTVRNNGGGWFIQYGVTEEEPQATDFLWSSSQLPGHDPAVTSLNIVGFDALHKDGTAKELCSSSSSKKRSRTESLAEPGTKACREKLRRDRLNDRFHELSSLLDPSRSPTSDKVGPATVLNDAVRRLSQLRVEVLTLKKSNDALQENIRNVKIEKVELRNEKARLKAEKERLEQILKGMITPTPLIPHSTVTASHHHPAYTGFSKTTPHYANRPPVAMWQWIPPAILDTSEDLVLRPPAA